MTVHIFVGPTVSGQDVLCILPGAVVHPPVAFGDLLRLGLAGGDVAVIVDGYYHQRASVRHKEILALLATGVTVIGCASMGALRAAELAEYGMIGNGAVYRMYRDGVLEADDEVAVAHTPAPDYRSLTVPMVVVRYAADLAVRAGVIDAIDAMSIIAAACDIHYTERSWQALEHALDVTDSVPGAVARLRKFVDSHPDVTDIKAVDVFDTLRKIADGELRSAPGLIANWVARDWHNRFLDEWQAEFAISMVGDIEVGHSTIVRYQQLYFDDFPARWERFALGEIVGIEGVDDDLIACALLKAAGSGLEAGLMTDAQLAHWLTAREAVELSAEEALVRVLVRSYRPLAPTRDLLDAQPDLIEDDTARQMVAEATVVNREIETWGGKLTVDHLKLAALRAHLARTWQVDDTEPAVLLAAARDRGFATVDEAVDAARMFFLHKSFLSAAR